MTILFLPDDSGIVSPMSYYYVQENRAHRPTFSTNSESLEMATEECLILVLLLLQSNQLIPPSHRVTNQLQLFKVKCTIL